MNTELTTNCNKCAGKMVSDVGTSTCVGYFSPEGHDHNDNCVSRFYECETCGYSFSVSKQNKCPACDWVGKSSCFCHEGEKLKEMAF